MRPWPVLLALVLAGCVAAPPAPPGGTPALAFQDLQRLPGERLGAEPNLAANDAGDVWVIAVGSVLADPQNNLARGKVNLWHSGDRGATWQRQRDPGPQDKNGSFCSCDTDVDLAADGTLYITDFWVQNTPQGARPVTGQLPLGLPGGNGFVTEASHDKGATWDAGNPITVLQPSGNDRQYIVAGRDPGEVYLAYAAGGPGAVNTPAPLDLSPASGALPVGGLALWRSTDGGRTFAQASQVAPFGAIARPHVGPDGTVFFGWGTSDPAAEDSWNATSVVHVAASHDHGATWAPVDVGQAPDGFGGLWAMQFDVGPDGLVHVVWMARTPGGGSVLHYARSSDGGKTYGASRVVGWAKGTALLPWISAAGPGRAVIAYYGTPAAVEPLAAPNATRWQSWALVVDGNGSSAPVAVEPWPVKVGAFCPRGAACPQDRELLDYPAIIWHGGWVTVALAQSLLDPGAGPTHSSGAEEPRGGHSTNAYVWVARAPLS